MSDNPAPQFTKSTSADEDIPTNLDTNFLKIIGIITMTVDHIGYLLFPQVLILRIIGRIAFPLFAYCLMIGSLKTKNIFKYLLRLLLLAILFQLAYALFYWPDWRSSLPSLNIFFTLSLGLIGIISLLYKKWWLVPPLLVFAYYLQADYGLGGVLLIISFYVLRRQPVVSLGLTGLQLLYFQNDRSLNTELSLQSYSIFSLPFIYLKTNIQPKINKLFFYLYYPLHILLIYLISLIL